MKKSYTDEFIDKFQKFLNGSKTFAGMTFTGFYSMSNENFIVALKHYLDTGENVLDEFSELTHLSWEEKYEVYLPECDRERTTNLIENNGFWNVNYFMTELQKDKIRHTINRSKERDEYKITYEFRRKEACLHTAKPEVRSRIFNRDGEFCKKCNSTTNLQLDHIIPVSKGGVDDDSNLQVLCASCNAKKGNNLE